MLLLSSLTQFNFDLNEGILTVIFDETVNISSLQLTQFMLRSSALASAAQYSLTDSEVAELAHSSTIEINLSDTDLNAIKLDNELCTFASADNCFLSFPSTAASDMFGFAVNEVVSRNVSIFVNDTTPPELVSFDEIDLQNGTLTLSFSEAFNVSTLMPNAISLQNLFEPPFMAITLNGGNFIEISATVFDLQLSMNDLAALKKQTDICTYRGDCYIGATSSLLQDNAGNDFAGVPQMEPGKIVQMFIQDAISPMLVMFSLDMDSDQLQLVFNEPVDVNSVITSRITLQAAAVSNDTYTLTGGLPSSTDALTIVVNLTTADSNGIKKASFATSSADTFLTLDAGAIMDLATTPNSCANDLWICHNELHQGYHSS